MFCLLNLALLYLNYRKAVTLICPYRPRKKPPPLTPFMQLHLPASDIGKEELILLGGSFEDSQELTTK